MDLVINCLVTITITLSLVVSLISAYSIEDAKTSVYQQTRTVNQNSLIEALKNTEITETQMLNIWLENISIQQNKKIEDLEVTFYYISDDPICYVVSVKDYYGKYKLSKDGYQKLISAITTISKKSVD